MNDKVSIAHNADIAVVSIENPPVNALGPEVRAGIFNAIDQLSNDPSVTGIVLAGSGRTFSAGADIKEFGRTQVEPSLPNLIAKLESTPKPLVAAIHGTVLGGGLELSLGCHARVAASGTSVGLPEVKLGLLPGAGGTQRLPRIIGPEAAVNFMVTGDPISAEQARDNGLIDEVSDEPVQKAIAIARAMAESGTPVSKVSDDDSKLEAAKKDSSAFEEAAAALLKRSKGLKAPAAIVDAVRRALTLPPEEALARDRTKFLELIEDPESKAQRYAFLAERAAAKVAGVPKGTKARDIERVAVIGAGTMGGGIAMSFVNAGLPVTLIETSDENLQRGLGIIEKNYRTTVSRGRLSEAEMAERMALITGAVGIEAVADADLVIEAVFEEMDIKKSIFGDLDRLAKPDAVLATNTSYLDVNEIAAATSRPASVVGMHFFSPANIMKLLEVVRADETAPEVLATAIAVGRKTKKVPVVVGVCHGFVGNRMLRARSLETEQLLLEGASPQDVDGALKEFGFPMGPFAMADMAGLDIGWRMRKAQGLTAPIADPLCEEGRYGQKTGKGFYIYEAGNRTPVPDPEVEKLIEEKAAELGIERREIGKDEIIERLVYPMVSEGAKILQEGIAQRPGDIDTIWINGYGFPIWRGGPMYYADQVGLGHIRDRLKFFAERSGKEALKPAPLLEKLADEDKGFASLA
jgi:3-hydroxyacyl-CoA dehydrogenase